MFSDFPNRINATPSDSHALPNPKYARTFHKENPRTQYIFAPSPKYSAPPADNGQPGSQNHQIERNRHHPNQDTRQFRSIVHQINGPSNRVKQSLKWPAESCNQVIDSSNLAMKVYELTTHLHRKSAKIEISQWKSHNQQGQQKTNNSIYESNTISPGENSPSESNIGKKRHTSTHIT
jgi:hypothetical protein